MLNVYIGYDEHEIIAYHVLAHSIMRRASMPVAIHPIMLSQLKGTFNRLRSPQQSTDFTYSRFLTPWLDQFKGLSLFLDCDMLCLTDITELFDIGYNSSLYEDVLVVKHDYNPKPEAKFLNQQQTVYPCKNWSSLMMFKGYRMPVRGLTPEYVNKALAMDLHQFKWAENVGSLPVEWNHLVGEYEPNPNAKIVHFTRGGPWFKNFEKCEYAKEWFDELQHMLHAETYNIRRKNTVSL